MEKTHYLCSVFYSNCVCAVHFKVNGRGVVRLPFFMRVALEDHGVGSSDHFQESVILIMIHYCLNSHIICLDK